MNQYLADAHKAIEYQIAENKKLQQRIDELEAQLEEEPKYRFPTDIFDYATFVLYEAGYVDKDIIMWLGTTDSVLMKRNRQPSMKGLDFQQMLSIKTDAEFEKGKPIDLLCEGKYMAFLRMVNCKVGMDG